MTTKGGLDDLMFLPSHTVEDPGFSGRGANPEGGEEILPKTTSNLNTLDPEVERRITSTPLDQSMPNSILCRPPTEIDYFLIK